MANYHAVYIDSPASWTYNTDSYDSKLGFYSNAWLTNETEETSETPVISCSYFYELGKQDEVGFTPRRISMSESSGILTVEGKQENVSSLVSKSFRLNSPSPRFLNLRESMRKRRPARFIVNNIITDDDAELNNIKDYLGLNEEEAEAISRSEEFGAEEFDDMGFSLNMTRFSYQPEQSESGLNGREILSYSIYFGNDRMFNLNSALFGYDDERVQRIVDELNESIRSSMQQVFQRLNWKSQRHDSLDVMLRSEGFEAPQPTIHLDPVMSMIKSQYDNVGIDRVLSIREDYDGDLFITILLTNGNRQQLIIEKWKIGTVYDEDKDEYVRMDVEEFSLEDGQRIPHLTLEEWTAVSKALGEVGTFHNWNHELKDGEGGNGTTLVVDKKNGAFGRRNEYMCNGCGQMQSAGLFGEFRKHEPLTWCDYCEDEEEERLERLMGAEEFRSYDYYTIERDTADVDFDEAYMERQDAERIMKLLKIVKRKATGSNARYAKTYAREAENAYYQYGMRGLTTQVAYVLSNLSGWRGEEAKSVKAELRKLIK